MGTRRVSVRMHVGKPGLREILALSEINPSRGVDGPKKLRIMRASCGRPVADKAPPHKDFHPLGA